MCRSDRKFEHNKEHIKQNRKTLAKLIIFKLNSNKYVHMCVCFEGLAFSAVLFFES